MRVDVPVRALGGYSKLRKVQEDMQVHFLSEVLRSIQLNSTSSHSEKETFDSIFRNCLAERLVSSGKMRF
jgi:transcriptional regulator CtsR